MKLRYSKALLSLLALSFTAPNLSAQPVAIKTGGVQSSTVKQATADADFLNDALLTIQEELKKSDGDAYCVNYRCSMRDNEKISTSTKVYRTQYRRKPSRTDQKFVSTEVIPDHVVEVVYKPSVNRNTVSVITKDPTNPSRRLGKSKAVKLAHPLLFA